METSSVTSKTKWLDWVRVAFIGRRPRRTLARVAVLVALSFVVFGFILRPVRVTGASMLPTYRDGGINFVNRLAYLRHEPRRGDVVSIRLAGPRVVFMKRVIALPGETITFVRGRAIVNGEAIDEPYVKLPCDWEHPPEALGLDEYYCVGDNRSMPWQYHSHGKVRRERIVGKLLL